MPTKRQRKLSIKTIIPHPATPTARWMQHTKGIRHECRLKAVSIFYDGKDIENGALNSVPLEQISLTDIERIERDGLTDEEFFRLLQETPLWLISEPFQEKITLWQKILHDRFIDMDFRKEAQKRLKAIGERLAFVGQGVPKKYETRDKTFLYTMEYYVAVADLEPIMPELNKCDPVLAKEKILQEKLPSYVDYANLATQAFTARGLAIRILAERHGVDEKTIENHLKKGFDIYKENPFAPRK